MRALLVAVTLLSFCARASAQDAGVPDAAAGEVSELDASVSNVPDAAAPDAGAPDAGASQAAEPDRAETEPTPDPREPSAEGTARAASEPRRESESDVFSILSELMFERTERAEAEARRAGREARRANERLERRELDRSPQGTLAPPPEEEPDEATLVHLVDETGGIAGWSLPDPRIKTGGLIFLIAFAVFGIWLLQRLRAPLPDRGLLPRTLGVAHIVIRVTVVVMGIMLVSRLLPEWLRPALLLAMGAVALTVGAGAAVIMLPDIVGGLLLVTEGRIKAGLWIEGDGFRGAVVRIGPRLTILRVPNGTNLSIPNRRLVKSPIHAAERRWHLCEARLKVGLEQSAATIRGAIEETVLCSPFVPVEPALEVTRDPAHPTQWTVKARLLHVGFEDRFKGQLLERVEDALEARRVEPVTDEPVAEAPAAK